MRHPVSTAVFAALLAGTAVAADKEKFGTLPAPPAPVENYRAPAAAPEPAPADEAIPEPEVTIVSRGEDPIGLVFVIAFGAALLALIVTLFSPRKELKDRPAEEEPVMVSAD